MRLLVFDTETTSLVPGSICQLSYLIKDNKDIVAKNFFFKVNYIEPESQKIHGLSIELLNELSNNKRFLEYSSEIKSDFEKSNILISHNYEFDLKFIITEFSRCKQKIKCNKGFCTMRYFTSICKLKGKKKMGNKYPTLKELANFLDISENELIQKTIDTFQINDTNFHDARFDVVTTYLCYIKAVELGYINEAV